MNEELADILRDFARTMATDTPVQRILDRLVGQVTSVMPVDGAAVTLFDGETGRPGPLAAAGPGSSGMALLQAAGWPEGPGLVAHRTKSMVAVPDLPADERFAHFAGESRGLALSAVFSFPLCHGDGASLGALDLYRAQAGPLDEAILRAAQTLADVTAAYILNVRARQDLKEASDRYRTRALHDDLTGLPNRALFGELLDQALLRTQRSGKHLAVLYADLDRFKEVNDTLGHHVGDELLVAVARRLGELLRPEDTVARLAGDEFVVLCEGLDGPAEVERLAGRIQEGMKRPLWVAGLELYLTMSVGIASCCPGDHLPARLLQDADAAMYRAKRAGGARHHVFDPRAAPAPDHRIVAGEVG